MLFQGRQRDAVFRNSLEILEPIVLLLFLGPIDLSKWFLLTLRYFNDGSMDLWLLILGIISLTYEIDVE